MIVINCFKDLEQYLNIIPADKYNGKNEKFDIELLENGERADVEFNCALDLPFEYAKTHKDNGYIRKFSIKANNVVLNYHLTCNSIFAHDITVKDMLVADSVIVSSISGNLVVSKIISASSVNCTELKADTIKAKTVKVETLTLDKYKFKNISSNEINTKEEWHYAAAEKRQNRASYQCWLFWYINFTKVI